MCYIFFFQEKDFVIKNLEKEVSKLQTEIADIGEKKDEELRVNAAFRSKNVNEILNLNNS